MCRTNVSAPHGKMLARIGSDRFGWIRLAAERLGSGELEPGAAARRLEKGTPVTRITVKPLFGNGAFLVKSPASFDSFCLHLYRWTKRVRCRTSGIFFEKSFTRALSGGARTLAGELSNGLDLYKMQAGPRTGHRNCCR